MTILSLYILTFKSNADIPAKKHIFYRRVIQALFSEHDSQTKVGYIRQKQSGLVQEDFETVLQLFCYLSYFESKFSWDTDFIFDKFKVIKTKSEIEFENQNFLKDLSSAVSLWIEDNGLYSFAHRSLQEYFVSLFIKHMTLEGKEIVYKKIVKKFTTGVIIFESNNFISLLEEMDELNFNKLYHLPLLLQIEELLDFTDDKIFYLSFIRNSFSNIFIDDSQNNLSFKINESFSKLSYFKESYLMEMHSIIYNSIKGIDKEILFSRYMVDDRISWELSLLEELPTVFVQIIYDKVLDIANLYKYALVEEIEKTKAFIKKSEKNDMDFADLI